MSEPQEAERDDETPRIYVACLASYNGGILHGRWIECDQDEDEIFAEIKAMLAESPEPHAEEWAIHDHENFHRIEIGEYSSIATVAEQAAFLTEHGFAWAAYVSNVGIEHATSDDFQESYQGEWKSEEEFAEQSFRDCHTIPDELEMYIDWEKVARDFFMGDYTSIELDGKLFVFRNC